MARKGLVMTREAAEAHQRKHGFDRRIDSGTPKASEPPKLPKPRQNATEREYGLILEAMKRRGEIVDYRPFGIKLEWGADPVTGKPMIYSGDFCIFRNDGCIEITETKGGYIFPKDLIRFKGCRAEWGDRFGFSLWQKAEGTWRRLF